MLVISYIIYVPFKYTLSIKLLFLILREFWIKRQFVAYNVFHAQIQLLPIDRFQILHDQMLCGIWLWGGLFPFHIDTNEPSQASKIEKLILNERHLNIETSTTSI